MDVKEFLEFCPPVNNKVELTGWLVDRDDGLFLLGDHFPEDYEFTYRVKIVNQNIILPILKTIPRLGGGKSSLFYRTRAVAVVNSNDEVKVEEIFIQANRESQNFVKVDVSDRVVMELERLYGSYEFKKQSNPMRDWLDDI